MARIKQRKRCEHCGRTLTMSFVRELGYRWCHKRGQGDRCREIRARRAALAEKETT